MANIREIQRQVGEIAQRFTQFHAQEWGNDEDPRITQRKKMEEEFGEFIHEFKEGDIDRLTREGGDVLFTILSTMSLFGIDAQQALTYAMKKSLTRTNPDMVADFMAQGYQGEELYQACKQYADENYDYMSPLEPTDIEGSLSDDESFYLWQNMNQ